MTHSSLAFFVSGHAQHALHFGFSAGAAFSGSLGVEGDPIIEDNPNLSSIFLSKSRDVMDAVREVMPAFLSLDLTSSCQLVLVSIIDLSRVHVLAWCPYFCCYYCII